jgi:putative lipoprotein
MVQSEPTRIVSGEVLIPEGQEVTEAAQLVVQVEDVSRADAPSIVVGEQRQERVRIGPGSRVPFEVTVPANLIRPNASYSVRVHVDITGSGEVERGDLVSTQSHPVLTRSFGTEARIPVRRV